MNNQAIKDTQYSLNLLKETQQNVVLTKPTSTAKPTLKASQDQASANIVSKRISQNQIKQATASPPGKSPAYFSNNSSSIKRDDYGNWKPKLNLQHTKGDLIVKRDDPGTNYTPEQLGTNTTHQSPHSVIRHASSPNMHTRRSGKGAVKIQKKLTEQMQISMESIGELEDLVTTKLGQCAANSSLMKNSQVNIE